MTSPDVAQLTDTVQHLGPAVLGLLIVAIIVIVLINIFTCGLGAGVTFIAGAYAYKTLNGDPVAS